MAERLPTPEEQSGVPGISKARHKKAKERAGRIRAAQVDIAERVGLFADLLREANEEKDWLALGYTSWKNYVTGAHGISEGHSYRLMDRSKVAEAIRAAIGSGPKELVRGDVLSARQASKLKGTNLTETAGQIADAYSRGESLGDVIETTATRLDKRGQGIIEPETSQQGEDVEDGAGRDHSGSPADTPGAVATTREVAEATSESKPDTREQHPDPDQGAKTAGTPGQSVSLVAACKRILLADREELALIGALAGEVVDHLRQHTFKAIDRRVKPSTAPKAPAPRLNRYSQPAPLDPAPRCKHERKKQRKGASGMVITECPDCNGVWR